MNKLVRMVFLSMFLVANTAVMLAQSAPRIFFTDVDSGPNTGGEIVSGFSGSYVTIYGDFFGSTQGASTVTLNSTNCLRVGSWGGTWLWYQRIVVQLGSSCTTGNFVVSVNGQSSNGVPFTVRSGHIYCVSTSGSDASPGTFSGGCWRNPRQAKNSMVPGDITYVRAGTYGGQDGDGAVIDLHPAAGTTGNPLAMVGYPGEIATLDASGCCQYVFFSWGSSGQNGHDWTIANLNVAHAGYRGIYWENQSLGTIRIVGNSVHDSQAENVVFEGPGGPFGVYGNDLYNMDACGAACKGYGIYWGAYGVQTGIDFGWNRLHYDLGGNVESKGMQFYGHVSGDRIQNVKIHDSVFFNHCMEAIVMGGSDAPDGHGVWDNTDTEYIWNNLFVHNGSCDPNFGYSAVKFVGDGAVGNFKLWNNIFYANGNNPNPSPSGDVLNQGVNSLEFSNNVFNAPNSPTHYCGYICYESGSPSQVSGSNNLFFNFTPYPTEVTASITGQNPNFANPTITLSTADFHLQSNSPAIDKGKTISSVTMDLAGVPRPQGTAYDIGAYEFATGTTVQRPNPPTNLRVNVQ